MTKTTIIIPNYNGAVFLKNCLNSIYQDTVDAEVLVVDNASSDESREVLLAYPQVTVISLPENLGFSAAVNLGIRRSETEYVLLLNNDTVLEKGFLEAMEAVMDQNPKLFSGSSQMRSMSEPDIIDNAGDFYCALGWAFGLGKGRRVSRKYSVERMIFSSCAGAAIYRRKLFSAIGYFDELHFAYLEDIDIGYRARILGYQNRYIPKAIVYHAGSASSGSKYNEFKVKLSSRNSVYLILKNMPFLQILINLPFLIPGFAIKAIFFSLKGMGKIYLKGLWTGVCLYCQKGRKKHIAFQIHHIKYYIRIQLELWYNMIRKAQDSIFRV